MNSVLPQTPAELLSDDGPFAQLIDNYKEREQQQHMADAVAGCLDKRTILLAEAGTGVGKTFAYLVPAILSGQKVVVSTGTKNLQDQLFKRDLPVVCKALNVPVQTSLLKGRKNYLCRYRLDQAHAYRHEYNMADKLEILESWQEKTVSGDISEVADIPEADPVWFDVTSTNDNCLGQDCNYYDNCFVYQARRDAQVADLVVVNHHLLLSDMAIRDSEYAELLPAADAYIVDEAHQLPDIANNFFGTSLSSNQLAELATDIKTNYIADINESTDVQHLCDELLTELKKYRLAFGRELKRGAWSEVHEQDELVTLISRIDEMLENFSALLDEWAKRSKSLANCALRCTDYHARFRLLSETAGDGFIHWFETHKKSVSLHLTPIDIGNEFSDRMDASAGSWIFTSATLSVNNNFEYFKRRLGLKETESILLASPFNFLENAQVYMPSGLDDPGSYQYTEQVVEKALPLIRATSGGIFFLFTSYRALDKAKQLLEDRTALEIFVQGTAPRNELLNKFRRDGNAILLGTSSFWEGVDVKGQALSCVIIDKLPFASPQDPLTQARIAALNKSGINAFMMFQLPQAIIMLRQGVGRLIRDFADKGVIMLCDPRLTSRQYGNKVLAALPAIPLTQSEEMAVKFLKSIS